MVARHNKVFTMRSAVNLCRLRHETAQHAGREHPQLTTVATAYWLLQMNNQALIDRMDTKIQLTYAYGRPDLLESLKCNMHEYNLEGTLRTGC